MNTRSIIYFSLLGFFVLGFAALASFVSFSNRIEGDAGFHALISREIAEKGKIIDATSYITANEKNNFPIAYPQIFHLIGGINYLYMGNTAFMLLPILYGTASLYFLIIIFQNLHKNLAAIIIGVSLLIFNVHFLDYSSKYFMEIGLVFATLGALAYSMKYLKQNNVSNLYIASLFFGFSVAIKQQGLIALPIFLLLLFFNYRSQRSFKIILICLLLFTVIAAGPMFQLFHSTGSILYAGDNPPKIIQMIEKPAREMLGIKVLEGDKAWSLLNEGRREGELTTWRNVSNNTAAWIEQENNASIPWAFLTGILLIIILLVKIIKTRNSKDILIFIFLTSFYLLLFYLARPRYALPLIILPSVTLFYIISICTTNRIHVRRYGICLFVGLLMTYTIINFSSVILDTVSRDDYGYFGIYNPNRSTELQQLYDPIKKDHSRYFTILSPIPYETAFYTQHATVWANPYGATNLFNALLAKDEQNAIKHFKTYRVKYIVIYNDRFMKFTNWAGITPSDGFFSRIDNLKNFNLINQNNSGRVYAVSY